MHGSWTTNVSTNVITADRGAVPAHLGQPELPSGSAGQKDTLAEVLQEGAKEGKSSKVLCQDQCQFELGIHPVAVNDTERQLALDPMVLEAGPPMELTPPNRQDTQQAHPSVLIPNQTEPMDAEKLPSQADNDAAPAEPGQTTAEAMLDLPAARAASHRPRVRKPATDHEFVSVPAAEAAQDASEATTEQPAAGHELVSVLVAEEAYPVNKDSHVPAEAQAVAAEDPCPVDTQTSSTYVACIATRHEETSGADGQAATATIIELAGSPIAQTSTTAVHAQPANDTDSIASPAVTMQTPRGVSDNATPTTAEVAQRLATFTNAVQLKR